MDTAAPFFCKYTVKAVDPEVTDMTPFRPRQRTDSNGRVCCEDNSEAIEANRDKAELMTSLMKNMTAIEVMQVESRGAGRFRVSRRQDSMTGAWVPSESAEVDLDSRR